jgi:hypothetical protein
MSAMGPRQDPPGAGEHIRRPQGPALAAMPVLRRGRVVRFPRERFLAWLLHQESRRMTQQRRKRLAIRRAVEGVIVDARTRPSCHAQRWVRWRPGGCGTVPARAVPPEHLGG